jgi:nucleotide-binding universal stress UspA family protein
METRAEPRGLEDIAQPPTAVDAAPSHMRHGRPADTRTASMHAAREEGFMTTEPAPGSVVVGVEDGGGSRATIRMAAQEARFRHAPLIAVMAYSGDRAMAPAARPAASLRTVGEEHLVTESALRDAVIDALGEEADRVELRTALGLAGRNLVDTARRVNAALIVLAGRGSTSMLLGTVSQYVLRKAPCPVLVVPEAG